MSNPTLSALLILEVIALGMGVFIFFHNRRSIVHWSFAICLIGLAIIIIGFMLLSSQYPFAVFDPVVHYGSLIMLFGLLIFSKVFPSGTHYPKIPVLLYLPFVIVALVLPTHLIIESAIFDSFGHIVAHNGPLFILYGIFWITYVYIPLASLVQTYRRVYGKERQQMQYLFAGFIVMLISFIIFGLILPMLGISYLYFMSAISSILLIVLTVLAIVRHQLLDIRIVIQRGLIYLILLAATTSIYIAGMQFLGHILGKAADDTGFISAGITMLLGILFFHRIETYFRKVTDHIFFKERYEYPVALHQLSKALYTNVNTADIVQTSSSLLEEILKTRWVAFRLLPFEECLVSTKVAVSIEIVFEGNLIGVLELGPKKSGDGYSSQDMQLLDTFVYQAAIALEKARLYENMEHLVHVRTEELQKLQEDQKQAMIDISHNLQTPLAVIKGEIEQSTWNDEKIPQVQKSIKQVSAFIRQLLHLAKLDHGAFGVELAPIDLSALLLEQSEYFEVMAAEQGIEIVIDIAPSIAIQGNKKLINELLINLISNAIKYRCENKDECFIYISLLAVGEHAHLSIEDTGIGIAAEDLPHVFDRFYRGTHARVIAGTGLGLAICKKIAEKHNGTISCTSTLGEKTSFDIVFPISG